MKVTIIDYGSSKIRLCVYDKSLPNHNYILDKTCNNDFSSIKTNLNDELKTKLDRVLGLGSPSTPNTEEVPFDGGKPYTAPPKPAAEETTTEDDDLGYFQKLAEEA